MKTFIMQTIALSFLGSIALGLLLFLPAWTLAYWQAWVFLIVFLLSTNTIGVYLYLEDPALLARRKKIGFANQSLTQNIIISIALRCAGRTWPVHPLSVIQRKQQLWRYYD